MKIMTANMPIDRRTNAFTNRICTQRRTDRPLFEVLDARRQCAGAQHQGEVLRSACSLKPRR